MFIKSTLYLSALVVAISAQDVAPAPTTPPTIPSDPDFGNIVPRQCATVTTVVRQGDTLSGIAGQLGVGVCNLAASNNIPNINSIYASQTLRVRQSGCEPVNNGPSCSVTRRPAVTRTAVAGDSFWRYALSQGIPVASVAAANPGVAGDNIPVGRAITVPSS